jgi:hypothetical protein
MNKMKIVDYINKEDFFECLYYSNLSEYFGPDETDELWDRFVSYLKHATERIHVYDALWSALPNKNINMISFNDCAYNILMHLPEYPVLHEGKFTEEWNVVQKKPIIKKDNISLSLEKRVDNLEKDIKELKAQIQIWYGGRM